MEIEVIALGWMALCAEMRVMGCGYQMGVWAAGILKGIRAGFIGGSIRRL